MTLDDAADIVVPGSISNLGPAFDTLSVAVNLYLRVRIVARLSDAPDTLETEFVGGAPGGTNRIEEAFKAARERCGAPTPGLRIQACSEIPPRGGLGSSAAATIAGLWLYDVASGGAAAGMDWLAVAAGIEGHPDNAAAAFLGGLTLSCQHDDGRVTAHSWRWPPQLRFVVATPDRGVDTPKARAVLPAAVPLRDAVFNLQRTVLLTRALESGDFGDLREALRDRVHQPVRAPLVPGLEEALAFDHPSVLGVCLSGSGPSIVALVTDGAEQASALFEELYLRLGLPCTIRTLSAHQSQDL